MAGINRPMSQMRKIETEAQLESSVIPAVERKPLAGLLTNQSVEKKELVELLFQDIVRPSGVSWDDIVGLESAKALLMESVIYPVREIDPAMLRRLEKRIYIPLPDFKARVQLFEKFLSSKTIELYPKVDFQELAAKTEGYSGSDIKLVCKEALMSAVRKILPNMLDKGCQANRKDRLNISDILTAIEKTKPISKNFTKKHEQWQSEMGCS
ncbi:unnamed protein product [Chilo suppressalis]|uniref:AAA ATPase AAA+ lid domain-containing protein n=1 Tax=Chilo suppressalis TaxID=168631 RepID=A0ABN8AW66_CHISP|nr:unnamed protein product [Chilo suppressalis]